MASRLPNYDKFAAEYENTNHRPSKNPFLPQKPFRMLLVGPSGSGKTNALMAILMGYDLNDDEDWRPGIYYDKLYLFAPELDEGKYQWLSEGFMPEVLEARNKKRMKRNLPPLTLDDIFTRSSSLQDIPDPAELDHTLQHMVIFDDMNTSSKTIQQPIAQFFARGRKANASSIYLAQSYYQTPKFIRDNTSHIGLFAVDSDKEVKSLRNDFGGRISAETFIALYKLITKEPYQFMYIDKGAKQLPYYLRRGFEDLYDPKAK